VENSRFGGCGLRTISHAAHYRVCHPPAESVVYWNPALNRNSKARCDHWSARIALALRQLRSRLMGVHSRRMSFDWRVFALGSAVFAALTAIFGKLGVAEINSDLATFYRTIVILAVSALLISLRHEWQAPEALSYRGMAYLILSGVATGLSWLCYFRALQMAPASRVAPIDKFSVVLVVFFGVLLLGERLTWKIGVGSVLIAGGVILTAL
jgi:transporter family protein